MSNISLTAGEPQKLSSLKFVAASTLGILVAGQFAVSVLGEKRHETGEPRLNLAADVLDWEKGVFEKTGVTGLIKDTEKKLDQLSFDFQRSSWVDDWRRRMSRQKP